MRLKRVIYLRLIGKVFITKIKELWKKVRFSIVCYWDQVTTRRLSSLFSIFFMILGTYCPIFFLFLIFLQNFQVLWNPPITITFLQVLRYFFQFICKLLDFYPASHTFHIILWSTETEPSTPTIMEMTLTLLYPPVATNGSN